MKKAKIIFWVTTIIIFLFEGVMPALTSQTELAKEGIRHLGYPEYFGSALVIYPEESLTNIDLLCKILEKDKITFLYLPPNILQDVSSYILENNIQTSMNKMLVGVESIKNGTLNEYFKINPNFEIV